MTKTSHYTFISFGFLVLLIVASAIFLAPGEQTVSLHSSLVTWTAPDSTDIPAGEEGDLIRYGKSLVSHTSLYLGPAGIVRQISNGMNCQNCHLEAGTRPFGNNYAAVAPNYPKYRDRSGTIESVEKRVNDCLERSLNGTTLPGDSREMRAFVAYITWVGKDVPKETTPVTSGILQLPFLDRPADPEKGQQVYQLYCQQCHGTDGSGQKSEQRSEWTYPPLFGDASYTTAAGMYRLSKLAGYIKANMPFGVRYDSTVLSNEQAWDVAAFINSMHRPVKTFAGDWPDRKTKPFDHPFGPYDDAFSEAQHKYGPFGPIIERKKSQR